jgi:hypothetical protein
MDTVPQRDKHIVGLELLLPSWGEIQVAALHCEDNFSDSDTGHLGTAAGKSQTMRDWTLCGLCRANVLQTVEGGLCY